MIGPKSNRNSVGRWRHPVLLAVKVAKLPLNAEVNEAIAPVQDKIKFMIMFNVPAADVVEQTMTHQSIPKTVDFTGSRAATTSDCDCGCCLLGAGVLLACDARRDNS
jgi:hypothetical protein